MTGIEDIFLEVLGTVIDHISVEIFVTVSAIMYITLYLIKTYSKFKTIEKCDISIYGVKESHRNFSFIESIPITMFILLLNYNDDFIISILNVDSMLARIVYSILCFIIFRGLTKIIDNIMKNRQYEVVDKSVANQLRKVITVNIFLIFIIILSVKYNDNLGINRDYISMIVIIIVQIMIITSVKILKYMVKITETGIYLPHRKIEWETIVGYEFEDNLLIIKIDNEKGYEEYSINTYQEDKGKIARYITNRIA